MAGDDPTVPRPFVPHTAALLPPENYHTFPVTVRRAAPKQRIHITAFNGQLLNEGDHIFVNGMIVHVDTVTRGLFQPHVYEVEGTVVEIWDERNARHAAEPEEP